MKMNLNFGQAIEALKAGKRVAREGWNGKGLFVFMQVMAIIPTAVVPNMQSLPASVKAEFAKRNGVAATSWGIRYCSQLALVKPDNEINGWAPSAPDALAEDWMILDEGEYEKYKPHEQRVLAERDELMERTQKLEVFITTNALFESLPDEERERLCRQHKLMLEYWNVLGQRIGAFQA